MRDENYRKYLEMIQAVITRMAGNSFSIKGWSVGLIAILGGLAAKDADIRFASVLLFPALCFWGLDAYYLRQERLFRKLYEAVARNPADTNFSMDTAAYTGEVGGVFDVAISGTVRWLHLPILLFVIVLMAYAKMKT